VRIVTAHHRADDENAQSSPVRVLPWLVGIVAAIALIWFLRAAAVVVMPLAAAFFVTLVVHPVLGYLQTWLGPRHWAAVPLTMVFIVVVVGGGIWAAAEAIDEAAEQMPTHSEQLQESWEALRQRLSEYGIPVPQNLLSSNTTRQGLGELATTAVRGAWEIVSGLVLVLFLVLLMLLEAPTWNDNVRRLLRARSGATTIETVSQIAVKVRTYLYVRTLLGAASAAVNGIWLLVLDVDLVLVWVVLTFALNYIPNLGSIVAVIPPSLMALVQHGPTHALIVLGGLTVFEQIIGNVIDPRLQGRRLQISPVLVLIALVFWTWAWGPAGALLAVPMTVVLLEAALHVPALSAFARLLAAEHDGEA
jgi:AI-2 transport protein TqsA